MATIFEYWQVHEVHLGHGGVKILRLHGHDMEHDRKDEKTCRSYEGGKSKQEADWDELDELDHDHRAL
jgi:hypothetical protein